MRMCIVTLASLWVLSAAADVPRTILAQADIVFLGRVEHSGPTAPNEVPSDTLTVTVAVERVIAKPSAVVLKDGGLVTVAIAGAPGDYADGMRATFYTAGWVYGENVAVRELAHEPAVVAQAAAGAAADTTASALRDAKLERLIDAAEAVVVGRVISVASPSAPLAAATAETQGIITEHDPQWREATVEVESWIKGERAANRVAVRFPASIDVAWYDVPKLRTGLRGTFLLHADNVSGRSNARTPAGLERPTFALIAPTDLVPANEAPRVRSLTRQ